MRKLLKIGVASLALSAFAIAPAVIVISADTAIAKSEKSKGGGSASKGNSSSKSGSSASKGNKSSKASTSKKNKSSSARTGKSSSGVDKGLKSFGKNLKSGFGLFGTPKKKRNTTHTAAVVKAIPSVKIIKAFDHPSNLGKMNGAKNSSAQSKLAHIKNGNFNGPVGIAAAYALANYDYENAFADYVEAQLLIHELEPLAEAYDYAAGYDDAVEELARLDAEGADPSSDYYLMVAAAADADTNQNALNTIEEAETAAIEAGTTVSEEIVDALLLEASVVEEPDPIDLEEAEDNLFALYKGDEESLTDIEKEILIQSINLPSAEDIEEIIEDEEVEEVSIED